MTRIAISAPFGLLVSSFFSAMTHAATYTAATCGSRDVQSAINSTVRGDTVLIPAGTCTWTSGVTISGKGIAIKGAGSGRIIAYDDGVENLTVGTGALTVKVAGFSPGFSGASFTPGGILRVFQNNAQGNYMQGTVTSYVGGVLTMNITTTAGGSTTHRWLIATMATTTIVNNSASTSLFSITEDTSVHTNISGIHFALGTGAATLISLDYTSAGQAILIHDCWMEQVGGGANSIDSGTARGVIWNVSMNGSSGGSDLSNTPAIRIHGDGTNTAWTTPALWGSLDTTGQVAMYIETSDFHCLLASDNDSNGKMVWRYNLMDHAMLATHGADTSTWGQRYFEFYNNTGVFYGYNDGTTFNLNGWIFLVRGGTFVAHHNTLPAQVSTDYGTKADITMTVMNLQRDAGPNPCWGAGKSGGANYPAPRQVGLGYVTGNATAGGGSQMDAIGYVGDSEPVYIWGNSRSPLSVAITDYVPDECDNPDTSINYIVLNRDYFNGMGKPSYTPYTYPHPLTLGTGTVPGVPPSPTNLSATVQ
jgi:hypothetical protein